MIEATREEERVQFSWEGFEGWRHPELSEAALVETLSLVRAHEFGDDEFTLKRRRYQEIGKVQVQGGVALAVKRWRRPLGLPDLRRPERRAAASCRQLEAAGVSTPPTLASVRDATPPRGQADAVLVTRWMEGHQPITLLLAGNRPYERHLRKLLDEIATLVAQLHAAGIGHRDLRLENLLAHDVPAGTPCDLIIVDLDDVVTRRRWQLLGAARDLGNMVFHLRRIGISDHTSRRLLIIYASRRGLDHRTRARLCRRVFAIADLRAGFRSVKRITAWMPRLRARKSNASSGERQQRVYGVAARPDGERTRPEKVGG